MDIRFEVIDGEGIPLSDSSFDDSGSGIPKEGQEILISIPTHVRKGARVIPVGDDQECGVIVLIRIIE
jgi:hypothetical protein